MNIIVAFTNKHGIGLKNTMPWKLPNDLKRFKKLTIGNKNNAVIMGKNTFASLKYNPLPDRDNIILSKTLSQHDLRTKDPLRDKQIICSSLNNLHDVLGNKTYDDTWVIGGEKIYNLFLNQKADQKLYIKHIYATRIYNQFDCDTYFPRIPANFKLIEQTGIMEQRGIKYCYEKYENIYNTHWENYNNLSNNHYLPYNSFPCL